MFSLYHCVIVFFCIIAGYLPFNIKCLTMTAVAFFCYINKIEMNFNYTIIISVYMSKIGDWFYSKDTDW